MNLPPKHHFSHNNINFSLTQRELQCVQLLCKNLSYKGIGKELDLSHRMVEQHLQHVKEKVYLRTKKEIIYFFENIINMEPNK